MTERTLEQMQQRCADFNGCLEAARYGVERADRDYGDSHRAGATQLAREIAEVIDAGDA